MDNRVGFLCTNIGQMDLHPVTHDCFQLFPNPSPQCDRCLRQAKTLVFNLSPEPTTPIDITTYL